MANEGVFAERLKSLRLTKMMTRNEMSEAIGIPLSSLGNYERGDKIPSLDILMKICDFFDVSADYLIGRSNIQESTVSWLPNIPDDEDVKENIQTIKESVEAMLLSARKNPYGSKTIDSYATIINLLPDIDKFAAARFSELQKEYPAYRMFGTETELRFAGKSLLQALVDGSEEAACFAKRLTGTTSRIHDHILEMHSLIGNILNNWVFDAIKGQPLEKQPFYQEQMIRIKQALNEQSQAPDIINEIGGEEDGNNPETGE